MRQLLEIRADDREILGRPEDMSRPWGLFVRKDGFQGWEGLPAGRREALARAVEHGEHDVATYLPARVVTIDGWALAPAIDLLQNEVDNFTGIGGTGDRMPVTVQYRGATRGAYGRRVLAEASSTGQWYGRVLAAPFQLQFVFADPRRYGEENIYPSVGTATSIRARHWGNFPAFARVEIPNAPAAYTITSQGRTFTVTGAVPGGVHVADLRRGRVYRNGIEMPGVGRGDLWTVPPGQQGETFVLSVAGRLYIEDTFI